MALASKTVTGELHVVNAFSYGVGLNPNAQGDILVGDGTGGFAVKTLGTAASSPHSVLSVGPASAPPSTRLQWTPLTLTDATGTPAAPPGAVSLVGAAGATPTELTLRKIVGGTGIAIDDTASPSYVTVNANFVLGSAGGGPVSLVSSANAPGAPAVKTLEAGAGITLTEPIANRILIESSGTAAPTVTLASTGVGVSLVNDGTGPDLVTKGLTQGTGITLVNDGAPPGTDVIISSNVTLASAGAGVSLVAGASAVNAPVVKSLVAGSGILLTDSPTSVEIGISGAAIGGINDPRRGALAFPVALSLASPVGSFSIANATTWYPFIGYTGTDGTLTYTATPATGIITCNTGNGAVPVTAIISYNIVCRADALSGGIMAAVFIEGGGSPTIIPSTHTQSGMTPSPSFMAHLRCSIQYYGIVNGNSLRVYLRSFLGSGVNVDSSIDIYSATFSVIQVYPNP